jgi:antitoxin MazE
MVTRIQRWGNSQGLRVSKEVLHEAGIDVGELVSVTVAQGSLVVTPARRVRGALDLEELVGRIAKGERPGEAGWGPPAGGEVW